MKVEGYRCSFDSHKKPDRAEPLPEYGASARPTSTHAPSNYYNPPNPNPSRSQYHPESVSTQQFYRNQGFAHPQQVQRT